MPPINQFRYIKLTHKQSNTNRTSVNGYGHVGDLSF